MKNSKWRTKIIKHRRSYSLDFSGYDDENDDYFYSDDWKSNQKTDFYGYINRISSFKNGIAEENYVFHNRENRNEIECFFSYT